MEAIACRIIFISIALCVNDNIPVESVSRHAKYRLSLDTVIFPHNYGADHTEVHAGMQWITSFVEKNSMNDTEYSLIVRKRNYIFFRCIHVNIYNPTSK